MVLESTVVCVDGSDYMRNGDFIPTRLLAQQDAVQLLCNAKTRSHSENNVGLLVSQGNIEVLTTLTNDMGKILSKLHSIQPKGTFQFSTSIHVAQLSLKHRQNKNDRMRICIFVGSPIEEPKPDLVKLAKKLRKEKINVDVINFGNEGANEDILTAFIEALNSGQASAGSHLMNVSTGPVISDALRQSAIIFGEDGPPEAGGAGGFGMNEEDDPELAMALRISMEEQRQAAGGTESGTAELAPDPAPRADAALNSLATGASTGGGQPNFEAMTEEEMLEYAMQLSMQQPMDTSEAPSTASQLPSSAADVAAVLEDPGALQEILGTLPDVDADQALSELDTKKKDDGGKDDKK